MQVSRFRALVQHSRFRVVVYQRSYGDSHLFQHLAEGIYVEDSARGGVNDFVGLCFLELICLCFCAVIEVCRRIILVV